jgi:hypothetical protein
MAVTEGPRIRNNLADDGALAPDAIVVTFDWPSEFAHANLIRDANEKARLVFVAGCLRLLTHRPRRAASLATWTAAKTSAIKREMIVMTTNSSMMVNARCPL